MSKTYLHEIIPELTGDLLVSTADLLFSNKEQRAAWTTHWVEHGAPETVVSSIEALYDFGREAKEVTNSIRPITSPYDVIVKFAREKYRYPSFHWVTWPLDVNKQHMVDHGRNGANHYIRVVTKLVPTGSDLPAVESGGGYILTFMGPPSAVLNTTGAINALRTLCEKENVYDVLFRKYAGNKRLTYSVRAGEGYYKTEDGTFAVVEFGDGIDLTWFDKGAH